MGTALKMTVLAVAAIYVMQIGLGAAGAPLLVASVAGDVAAAVLVVVLARHWRVDLGLRAAKAHFVVAAVLVGASAWYIALEIVVWVNPPGDQHALERIVGHGGLAERIVALALFPALAEELVFRGVLARALGTAYGVWIAVVGSGVAFAAYHVMPGQMLGVLPLGLALGLLAVRSRSVVPGMIAHAINNVIALVLSRDELPGVSRVLAAQPFVTLAVASALFAGGIVLAAEGRA